MTTIGERIKQRRKELGITQAQIAKALGIKHSASICKLEADKRKLKRSEAICLAELLKTSPEWLLYGEEAPQKTDFSIASEGITIETNNPYNELDRLRRLQTILDVIRTSGLWTREAADIAFLVTEYPDLPEHIKQSIRDLITSNTIINQKKGGCHQCHEKNANLRNI